MGLDMYLYKKTYVQNWAHQKTQHKITVKFGTKVRKDIKPERICYITEQVAYWRKFNALHNWFVEECGKGIDECQDIHVSDKKLVELVEILKTVKASLDKSGFKTVKVKTGWANGQEIYEDIEVYADTSVAEDLLPTAEGFFFGGTEYGKWYYEDLTETINNLELILKEPVEEGCYSGDFYYRASW